MRDVLDWTWADFRAVPRLWAMDLRQWFAGFLLDHFGEDLKAEMGFRYMVQRARETGAAIYCPLHDCDASACPPGAHE